MSKVSIAELILLINQKEKDVSSLENDLEDNIYICIDRELDGNEIVTSKGTKDFNDVFNDYCVAVKTLEKLKCAKINANNTFKLKTFPLTINEAILKIQVLKKYCNTISFLSSRKEKMTRKTDGNGISSYYSISRLKYDVDLMNRNVKEVEKIINDLEADLQQTNATSYIEI